MEKKPTRQGSQMVSETPVAGREEGPFIITMDYLSGSRSPCFKPLPQRRASTTVTAVLGRLLTLPPTPKADTLAGAGRRGFVSCSLQETCRL